MLLGLLGNNDITGGDCWLCYSHSSYFAEVPDKYSKDKQGNVVIDKKGHPKENRQYTEYIRAWGISRSKDNNLSLPKIVKPTSYRSGDLYNEKPF